MGRGSGAACATPRAWMRKESCWAFRRKGAAADLSWCAILFAEAALQERACPSVYSRATYKC